MANINFNENSKNVRLLILDMEKQNPPLVSGEYQKINLKFDKPIGFVKNLVFKDIIISNTHYRFGWTTANYEITIRYGINIFNNNTGDYIDGYSDYFTYLPDPSNYTQRGLQKYINSVNQRENEDYNENNDNILDPTDDDFNDGFTKLTAKSNFFISRNGYTSINSFDNATGADFEDIKKRMLLSYVKIEIEKEANKVGGVDRTALLDEPNTLITNYFNQKYGSPPKVNEINIYLEYDNEKDKEKQINRLARNLGFIENFIFQQDLVNNYITKKENQHDRPINRVKSLLTEAQKKDIETKDQNIKFIRENGTDNSRYGDDYTTKVGNKYNLFLFSWNENIKDSNLNNERINYGFNIDDKPTFIPINIKAHTQINLNVNNKIYLVGDSFYSTNKLTYYMNELRSDILYSIPITSVTDEVYTYENKELSNVIEYNRTMTQINIKLLDENFEPIKYFIFDKCIISLLIELEEE